MERTSKTQRKREALSLQELGEKLTGFTEEQLKETGLPGNILEQVLFARGITRHGARKRQMQYLGVLMRRLEDAEPVRRAVQRIEEGRVAATGQHRQAEAWRDELISGSDAVLDEVLLKHPDADRSRLMRLVGAAREERARPGPSPAACRALFRYLYSLVR